ncbi:MAG: hypothetical protein RLO08_19320 [Parvibaculaceae bacterium]
MKKQFGWVAGLCAGLMVSSGALASGNLISFQNDTCVSIQLQAEGNDSCFGYGGCSLSIAPYDTKQVRLREGVRPKWAQVTVTGTCEEKNIVLEGQCAVDLEEIFRESGYRRDGAPRDPVLGGKPIFEEITGPYDPGVSHASVHLGIGLCEEVDGKDQCDVRCTTD